jgi:23S rRNA pseudouridine2605 synthase
MAEASERERLHKFLARAGVASRRDCEDLIMAGRVLVNGQLVGKLGTTVDPDADEVKLDGERVTVDRAAYFLVYKPKGVVCTTSDQFGRKSVIDLLGTQKLKRLFPVGRLEEDSEGLILVTNDGDFSQKVLSWKTPLKQTWHVRARGKLPPDAVASVRAGVWLSDGKTSPMDVRVLRAGPQVTTFLVVPTGQQHRQLRRVFAKVGVATDRIVRIRIGPLGTLGLKERGYRRLKAEEVQALLAPAPEHVSAPAPAIRSRGSQSGPPSRSPARPGRGKPGSAPRTKGRDGGRSRPEKRPIDRDVAPKRRVVR